MVERSLKLLASADPTKGEEDASIQKRGIVLDELGHL
jgi:hypothetical protein